MKNAAQQNEEQVLAIISLINASRIIPDAHKLKYVEYIQKHGFTEKMIEELTDILKQEISLLEKEIRDEEDTMKSLDELSGEKMKESDELQAKILAALEDFFERSLKRVESKADEVEKDIETFVEETKKESESFEIEAIRAKLRGEGGED